MDILLKAIDTLETKMQTKSLIKITKTSTKTSTKTLTKFPIKTTKTRKCRKYSCRNLTKSRFCWRHNNCSTEHGPTSQHPWYKAPRCKYDNCNQHTWSIYCWRHKNEQHPNCTTQKHSLKKFDILYLIN